MNFFLLKECVKQAIESKNARAKITGVVILGAYFNEDEWLEKIGGQVLATAFEDGVKKYYSVVYTQDVGFHVVDKVGVEKADVLIDGVNGFRTIIKEVIEDGF